MQQLVLHNVSKRFGRKILAVDDFSLGVSEDELLVLLGPSGCGKTTVLRMIAGLEVPDSGRIQIGGNDMHDVSPADRGVAMVHQSGVIYPHLSVRANIAFALRQHGVEKSEIESRIAAITDQLGIRQQLNAKPGTLSGGQRQRAALARALVVQPKLLLLDEPLASLDSPLRAQLRLEIRTQHQRMHSTTIYVTHDHEDALTLADRVAVMAHGRLIQVGTPDEVYRSPVNRLVARFISQPCLNELTRTVRVRLDTVELVDTAATNGSAINLHASAAAQLRKYDGKPITVAFRPQAMRVAGHYSTSTETRITLSNCRWRSHGDSVDVQGFVSSNVPVIARIFSTAAPSAYGQADASFEISHSDLLFFEADETGTRIS
ncbi:MAG TPA: ABC transporter ATP-binding protein [Phycisphaerales bacterium]|nr:ABC transporter ATP-binding protein [Phycisphaerales bacterium]